MTIRKPAKVTGDENVAIAAERLRISAILSSPEGKRNPAMAQQLALYSALDAETAKGILATAPAANPYLAALDRECSDTVSASGVVINGDPKEARLQELAAAMRMINIEKGYVKPDKPGV